MSATFMYLESVLGISSKFCVFVPKPVALLFELQLSFTCAIDSGLQVQHVIGKLKFRLGCSNSLQTRGKHTLRHQLAEHAKSRLL